jgi:hypothetical protein
MDTVDGIWFRETFSKPKVNIRNILGDIRKGSNREYEPIGRPEPKPFLSSLSQISRTRFLLRVVVCHIPKFFQISKCKIKMNLMLDCLNVIENSQRIKNFKIYLQVNPKIMFLNTFGFKYFQNQTYRPNVYNLLKRFLKKI